MLCKTLRLSRKSSSLLNITVVDTSSMLQGAPCAEQCGKLIEGLYTHGVVAIRDPRVDEKKNKAFLNLMVKYFQEQSEILYSGRALEDARPETGYQVGVTPELIERAREHQSTIDKHFSKHKVWFIFDDSQLLLNLLRKMVNGDSSGESEK